MRMLAIILWFGCAASLARTEEPSQGATKELRFVDNGTLRVGLQPASGGAIAWISASNSSRNLINHYDRGRLIQQSYYGREDGSFWNKRPWRWNPVQGGGWRDQPAKTLEFEVTPETARVRTLPKHWATGEDLPETEMTQNLRLKGPILEIEFAFKYSGDLAHPPHHQEIPAVYTEPDLDTLVLYSGNRPWTGAPVERVKPGWPNEYRAMSESWAAYVDANDFGLGVAVPAAKELTCFRAGFGDGSKPPGKDACAYFAPITTFAITPGFEWKYQVYVTIGNSQEIRERFREILAPAVPDR